MHSKLILTSEQEFACNQFSKFLVSNEKYFYLFGAAGCGKTFLIQHFLTKCLKDYQKLAEVLNFPNKYYGLPAITAPTNKAVAVLEEALSIPFAKNVLTTYKLFNLSIGKNLQKGFTYINASKVLGVSDCILVVDECSMVPKKLLEIIDKHTHNTKVIFVGDNYQLAPVKEKPQWDKIKSPFVVNLTQPVRNKGKPGLITICNQLRSTVDTGFFKPIKLDPSCIIKLDDNEALKWLKSESFKNSRILSYTNKQALRYIKLLKNLHNITEPYTPGLKYICNSPYEPYNPIKKITTEEEVVLTSISPTIFKDSVDGYSVPYYVGVTTRNNHIKICTSDIFSLLKQCQEDENWHAYYEIKEKYADLRPAWASTIHKSQGSTYDSVFIDLASFNDCTDPSVAARLLYVAFSRAKSKVYLYGSLPTRYGGIIK